MPLDHLTLITLAAHEPMKVLRLGSGAMTHAHCIVQAPNVIYEAHEDLRMYSSSGAPRWGYSCFYCGGPIELEYMHHTNTVVATNTCKGPHWVD